MKNRFPTIVKVTLVSLYLIFLAGSIVRMTGSGMGCPDWPKCFCYYIPPTSEEQITWQPNTTYKEGIIIIKNEILYVAEKKVSTSTIFNVANWKEYTKHEYATFNKFHTWVEYINRLITVLSGFIFLFLLAGSLKFRKEKVAFKYHSLFNKLLILSIIFSLIQIAMGTQVRQFIDEQVKLFGFENKEYSLMNPSFKFYFHRSFTIAIILVNFGLFYLNQLHKLGYKLVKWILVLLFLETITGILMYYAEFPLGTQAIHLLSGALLFGVQFYLWLQSRKTQ